MADIPKYEAPNSVQKAGWFASRLYANAEDDTNFDATGKFFKIYVGGFRPHFVINAEVFKKDFSAIHASVVELELTKETTGDLKGEFYFKLHVPDLSAATDIRYRVLVME